jgi:type II secretory pathway component PulF
MSASPAHKHLFYTEIAKLLEAGFDIRKAAAVLTDTRLPAPQLALLKNLNRGLDAGQSITAAFGRDGKSISELERGIIGAGERGGRLAPAFQHLADYFGMLTAARREMVRGMIYPIIVLHLGIFIAIVPGALMSGTMSHMQILGSVVTTLLVVYAAALVVVMAVRAILKTAPENAALDRSINRIPWIGAARRNLAMARFCKVYHSCLLAGISMGETVQLASGAAQGGLIRAAGKRLEQVAKAGGALGPAFMAEAAFPMAFSRSYSTGEEAGTLDKDLANWSRVFQENAASSARTMSVMVPKVMYFLILAFVAWKVVGFYGGYYESLDRIGE